MMLAERGEGTLAKDGYKAFSVIADKDTTALTEFIVIYAEQSARAGARVNELKARMYAMLV